MQYIWLGLGGIIAPISWVASDRKIGLVFYITKPLTMLALIAWLLASADLKGPVVAFLLGAVFGLLGDILLMLPEKWFLSGLVAFLLGQVSYTVGFQPSLASFWPYGVPLAAALVIIGVAVFRGLVARVRAKGMPGLVTPIFIYMIAILTMALSALMTLTNPAWEKTPAVLVSVGAMTFVLADSMLAWGRFVKAFPHNHPVELAVYHLAQFFILLGVGLNF